MKCLLTANSRETDTNQHNNILLLLKAQIENSIKLGWKQKDIVVISNFPFEFMSIQSEVVPLNSHCWTGSKMFAVKHAFETRAFPPNQVIWARDLDAWQNYWFEPPDFKDVAAAEYSRPIFNGGSVFWRKSAIDIVEHIVSLLVAENCPREEPTLDKVLRSPTYQHRVTVLNPTYNVGCSGFRQRFARSAKPILVSHFHPTNRIAWETHTLDRNALGGPSISPRTETLLRKYFPNLPRELSAEGMKRRNEHIAKNGEHHLNEPAPFPI